MDHSSCLRPFSDNCSNKGEGPSGSPGQPGRAVWTDTWASFGNSEIVGLTANTQAHLAIWKTKFSILACPSGKLDFAVSPICAALLPHTSRLQRQVSIMCGNTGPSLVNGTILAVHLLHVFQNVYNLHPASWLPSQPPGNMFWSVSSEYSQSLTRWGKWSMASTLEDGGCC